MRRLFDRRHAKIAIAATAAAAVAAMILLISPSLNSIQASLPQYGFFALRDLHIMLRDVTHWKDTLELAQRMPIRLLAAIP